MFFDLKELKNKSFVSVYIFVKQSACEVDADPAAFSHVFFGLLRRWLNYGSVKYNHTDILSLSLSLFLSLTLSNRHHGMRTESVPFLPLGRNPIIESEREKDMSCNRTCIHTV